MKKDYIDIFKAYIKEVYPESWAKVLKAMEKEPLTTFRINSNNVKALEFPKVLESLKSKGYEIKKGPHDNSFIITKHPIKKFISDTEEFKRGLIYTQELSSMLPPIILDPKAGEKVLDMAASPGSKTTQIAVLTENEAEIIAIEKHPIRIKTLYHNLELQGVKNVKVFHENGIRFDKRHLEYVDYFDKVLVDAPCSSEGQFVLSNPKTYKYWNIHKRKDMSKVQKGLLIAGIRMLKPGGTLVYSTCTFGVEENEIVINWLLEKIPDLEIKEITLNISNLRHGMTSYKGKLLDKRIKKSIRIIPDGLFTGFFVCKITKKVDISFPPV